MAKYVAELHYKFAPVDSDGTDGTTSDLVVYHDSYEEAVAFQSLVINPGFQVILEAMKQAGLSVDGVTPPGKPPGK